MNCQLVFVQKKCYNVHKLTFHFHTLKCVQYFVGTTSSTTTTTTITTDIKLDSHQAPVNRNDQYTVDDDDAG